MISALGNLDGWFLVKVVRKRNFLKRNIVRQNQEIDDSDNTFRPRLCHNEFHQPCFLHGSWKILRSFHKFYLYHNCDLTNISQYMSLVMQTFLHHSKFFIPFKKRSNFRSPTTSGNCGRFFNSEKSLARISTSPAVSFSFQLFNFFLNKSMPPHWKIHVRTGGN